MKLGAPLSGLQAEVRARINLDVEMMTMSCNLRCLVAQSHKKVVKMDLSSTSKLKSPLNQNTQSTSRRGLLWSKYTLPHLCTEKISRVNNSDLKSFAILLHFQ